MKFIVSMKDPDTLQDAIREAVQDELSESNLPKDEQELLKDARYSKVAEVCRAWFEYGEYLRVEVDTETKTCVVVPVKP